MWNKTKIFCIGYNQEHNFLNGIYEFRGHISGIYFPLPYSFSGSGRPFRQSENYENEIVRIIKFCIDTQINSEILLNSTCEGDMIGNKEHIANVVDYLAKLEQIGLKKVIVSNPQYIEKIKEKTSLIVEASVLLNVQELNKLDYLEELGIDSITLATEVNRDIEFIKKVKRKYPKLNLKLMVNEGCLPQCPLRQIHFNFIAHHSKGEELTNLFCEAYMEKHPESFFRIPIIRPEEIKNYLDFVDEFKLVTRSFKTDEISKCLGAYISRKHPGNLLDLIDVQAHRNHIKFINNGVLDSVDYLKNINSCDNNCDSCDFCRKLLGLCQNEKRKISE